MPTIDLDSPAPPRRRDVRVRTSRPLIVVLAGVVLFGIGGEPMRSEFPVDASTVCAQMPPVPGMAGEPLRLTVFDPQNEQIVQVIDCVMPFEVTGQ
ncbi:hypothetical protein AB0G04_43355 [Actinoplanes sp. NPDC023801]|uniref:hypothetical protein n=1 Tax=Actinoplanes sp. NPDC023801 TaxID=3154595 RepID=UPI0033F643FB